MDRTENFVFKNNKEDHIKILKQNVKHEYAKARLKYPYGFIVTRASGHHENQLEKNANKLKELLGTIEFNKFFNIVMKEHLKAAASKKPQEF